MYIIGTILIMKLFELQIIKGASYRELSNTRLSRESILEASRGEILDRSGNILATTTSSFNIEMYKTKTDDEALNESILKLVKRRKRHMKKALINIFLIIAFIITYLLQVNLFSWFKIARSNAKFIYNVYTFHRSFL